MSPGDQLRTESGLLCAVCAQALTESKPLRSWGAPFLVQWQQPLCPECGSIITPGPFASIATATGQCTPYSAYLDGPDPYQHMPDSASMHLRCSAWKERRGDAGRARRSPRLFGALFKLSCSALKNNVVLNISGNFSWHGTCNPHEKKVELQMRAACGAS